MQNKKVKHQPSTEYLYFHKITGLTPFFSGEKIEKLKKSFPQPIDQIFFFSIMLAETQLLFFFVMFFFFFFFFFFTPYMEFGRISYLFHVS